MSRDLDEQIVQSRIRTATADLERQLAEAQGKLRAAEKLRDILKHQAKWNSAGGRRWVCAVIAGELDRILSKEGNDGTMGSR